MSHALLKIIDLLLGDRLVFGLQKRILNGTILAGLLAHLLLMTEARVQGFSTLAVSLITAGIVFFILLYLTSRKAKEECTWCSTLFLIFTCSELLIEWFFLGGRGGTAVPLLIVMSAVTPGISASRKQLLSGLATLSITYLVLLGGSILYRDTLPRYEITLENNLEHLFETAIFCVAIFAVSLFIVHSYRIQRIKTAKLNEELGEANKILFQQNENLKEALQQVKTLKGILPVCATCNNIKTEDGTWIRFEKFISGRTEARFSHGICPDCLQKQDPELYQDLKSRNEI